LSEIQNIDWLFLSGKAFSQIAAPLAAEYHEFFTMTGFAPDPEKTLFKSPALQIRIKFLCDVRWQGLAVAGQLGLKLRSVLLNDLVK
jgi:hypothetical protein